MKNKRAHFRHFWMMAFGLAYCAFGVDVDEWKTRAEKGEAEAQFHYAEALSTGQGVLRDEFESVRMLRKAAEQGYAKAQAALGNRFKSGNGVEQDIVEGLVWLEKAALQGDVNAMTTVALCYVNGDGTPRNEVVAMKWLSRASKTGSRFAESTLDGMESRGAPKTDEEAAKAYRALASKGDVAGQIAFAACLEEGRGVSKNPADAAKWYRLAVQKGDLLAKYRLGLLLREKAETQSEGYEWLSIAAVEGIGSARITADALGKKLTAEQLTTAQAHVKERAKPTVAAVVPEAAGTNATLAAAIKLLLGNKPIGSGTGFFVSEDGYLVTNHHVVKGGKRFEIQMGEKKIPAKVIRTSAPNDLAVLKAEGEFPALEVISSDGVGLGDSVRTVGFPRPRVQGIAPKLSSGEIGSLRGMKDDPKQFQVSLPLQPGNSGGALVNKDGKVIGVVQSVLKDEVAFIDNGNAPQSVNYAMKGNLLLDLLSGIPDAKKRPPKPPETGKALSPIQQTEAASVLIWVYGE